MTGIARVSGHKRPTDPVAVTAFGVSAIVFVGSQKHQPRLHVLMQAPSSTISSTPAKQFVTLMLFTAVILCHVL
eukprot:16223901-Heterocapsa_arctica.AAC.1